MEQTDFITVNEIFSFSSPREFMHIWMCACYVFFFCVFFQIISFLPFSLDTLWFCDGIQLVTTVALVFAFGTVLQLLSFFCVRLAIFILFFRYLRCIQFFCHFFVWFEWFPYSTTRCSSNIIIWKIVTLGFIRTTLARARTHTHIRQIASGYVLRRWNQLFKLHQSCEKLTPSFSRKYNQTDCGKCISFHLRLKNCVFFPYLEMA